MIQTAVLMIMCSSTVLEAANEPLKQQLNLEQLIRRRDEIIKLRGSNVQSDQLHSADPDFLSTLELSKITHAIKELERSFEENALQQPEREPLAEEKNANQVLALDSAEQLRLALVMSKYENYKSVNPKPQRDYVEEFVRQSAIPHGVVRRISSDQALPNAQPTRERPRPKSPRREQRSYYRSPSPRPTQEQKVDESQRAPPPQEFIDGMPQVRSRVRILLRNPPPGAASEGEVTGPIEQDEEWRVGVKLDDIGYGHRWFGFRIKDLEVLPEGDAEGAAHSSEPSG